MTHPIPDAALEADVAILGKRGRGTKKVPVIGAVERGGCVVAKVAEPGDLSAKGISKFIAKFVDAAGLLLITDEYAGYNRVDERMLHAIVIHAHEYANGIVHTNTIENFWALVKHAWYGSHHHYSRKYMPLTERKKAPPAGADGADVLRR